MKKTAKAERSAIAIKKAKRKQIIIKSIFIIAAVAFVVLFIFALTRPKVETRVYATGAQSITLYDDGRFSFSDCQFVRVGRFTESENGDITTLDFIHNNNAFQGNIIGDILTIPNEWDSGKGHNPQLKLQ